MNVPSTMIVTGGSRGIGAATVVLAARNGYNVCVNYANSADRAEAVVAAIEQVGGAAIAVRADIGVPEQVAALFTEATERLGPIAALVNNAETYRLVATTEEGFIAFVKAWARWLSKLPYDQRLFADAAE